MNVLVTGGAGYIGSRTVKMLKEFGNIDIRDIINTAWNWHKNHPNGFGDLGGV